VKSTQKQPNCKNDAAHAKKKQHEKSCEISNTNSNELLLLKFLPLSDHHSHFWATTFDFTIFVMLLFFVRVAPFFTVWLFYIDYIIQV